MKIVRHSVCLAQRSDHLWSSLHIQVKILLAQSPGNDGHSLQVGGERELTHNPNFTGQGLRTEEQHCNAGLMGTGTETMGEENSLDHWPGSENPVPHPEWKVLQW